MSVASVASCSFSLVSAPSQWCPRRCAIDRSVACRRHSRHRSLIAAPLVVVAATSSAKDVGFHVARMRASTDPKPEPLPASALTVREALSDEELKAAAALRAKSFYVYPPEREFAGKVSFFFFSQSPSKPFFARSLTLPRLALPKPKKTTQKNADLPVDQGRRRIRRPGRSEGGHGA